MPFDRAYLKWYTTPGALKYAKEPEARSPELRPLSSYLHHRTDRAERNMRRSDKPNTASSNQSLDTYRICGRKFATFGNA